MRHALIIFLLLSAAAYAGTDYVQAVKHTRNVRGEYLSSLPALVEEQTGFKVRSSSWEQKEKSSSALVTYRISTEIRRKVDTLEMSYSWEPEWVFEVDKRTGRVRPGNKRALEWLIKGRT